MITRNCCLKAKENSCEMSRPQAKKWASGTEKSGESVPQECEELTAAMAPVQFSDDLVYGDIEGGEQGSRIVTLEIMRASHPRCPGGRGSIGWVLSISSSGR